MYRWALWDGSRGHQQSLWGHLMNNMYMYIHVHGMNNFFWHKNMFHTSWHLKVELIRELYIWWNRNKTNAGNIHVQYSTVHVVYSVLFLYKPRQPSIHVHTYIIILFTWSGSGLWWFWTSRLLSIITSTGQWTMKNESDKFHVLYMCKHVLYSGYISNALNFRILTTCPKIKTAKRN